MEQAIFRLKKHNKEKGHVESACWSVGFRPLASHVAHCVFCPGKIQTMQKVFQGRLKQICPPYLFLDTEKCIDSTKTGICWSVGPILPKEPSFYYVLIS